MYVCMCTIVNIKCVLQKYACIVSLRRLKNIPMRTQPLAIVQLRMWLFVCVKVWGIFISRMQMQGKYVHICVTVTPSKLHRSQISKQMFSTHTHICLYVCVRMLAKMFSTKQSTPVSRKIVEIDVVCTHLCVCVCGAYLHKSLQNLWHC